MKQALKELRIKADGLSQLVNELKPIEKIQCYNSPEIEKAYDSLILGKAWVGKMLGELGEDTPYKNDGARQTVADIEPAADKHPSDMYGVFKPDLTHVGKVDWLRQEISGFVAVLKEIEPGKNNVPFSRELSIARTNAYNHFCEARFWLGFELGRIRDASKQQSAPYTS